jgi:hypothetical protein
VFHHHPFTYYFADPMVYQGDAAQAFVDETFFQLRKTNEAAHHFGAANNLLLALEHFA